MTEAGRCVLCKKFVYIQLDLNGAPVKDYIYVCPKCKVKSGVVVVCTEDNTKMSLTIGEALKVFSNIPSHGIILLDKKARDAIIEELFSEDDRSYVEQLKAEISDDMEQISSFKSEISDLEIHIEKLKEELESCYTYRLIRM